MVLGCVEAAGGRAELLGHHDPLTLEVHALPAQRIQLPRPQAREGGDLEPCGKGGAGQVMCVAIICQTCFSLGGCWSRRPLPREMPSFWKGLQSIKRPAFIEAASLNIDESPCTVPVLPPPASHSATTSSPTWTSGRSP
jgi:hypothetical protein